MAFRSTKNEDGFTIPELLIVMVVLAALGYIVISNYSAIMAKQRNQTRQNDLKAMQLQIETFYSKYSYYPNLDDLNNPSWRAKNMKDLVASDMVDPRSKCNADTSPCLGGENKYVPKQFEYFATQADGTTSCNGVLSNNKDADVNCAKYKLIATYEGQVNGSKVGILQNRD